MEKSRLGCDLEQLPTAQVIRRFRALDIPVDTIRAVLGASEPEERNALVVAHLGRMEDQLASTQAAVESLRNLLEHPSSSGAGGIPIAVERRSLPPVEVLRIDDVIDRCYGALGSYVSPHELSIEGPVREGYLVSEFAWPIFRTSP